MYADALGLNGPSGNASATNAYQTSPGYDFQMQQGTQALDRSAAGSGLFGSGNAAMALNQYGQGTCQSGLWKLAVEIAGPRLARSDGGGGTNGRQGSLAGIDTGLGNAQAGVWSNLGNNVANEYTQGANADAAANAQGGANLFSALLGGANLGLKAFGVGGFAPATNNYYGRT